MPSQSEILRELLNRKLSAGPRLDQAFPRGGEWLVFATAPLNQLRCFEHAVSTRFGRIPAASSGLPPDFKAEVTLTWLGNKSRLDDLAASPSPLARRFASIPDSSMVSPPLAQQALEAAGLKPLDFTAFFAVIANDSGSGYQNVFEAILRLGATVFHTWNIAGELMTWDAHASRHFLEAEHQLAQFVEEQYASLKAPSP